MIKEAIRYKDTSNQYSRSIGGRAVDVWAKIPNDILTVGESDGWQKITKQCQRFLTGKKLVDKHNEKKEQKTSKYKVVTVSAQTISTKQDTILNNELNVKFDFIAIAKELEAAGIKFNKSLLTLKKMYGFYKVERSQRTPHTRTLLLINLNVTFQDINFPTFSSFKTTTCGRFL